MSTKHASAFTAARAEQQKIIQAHRKLRSAAMRAGFDRRWRLGGKRKRCAKAGVQLSFFPWKKIAINGIAMVKYLAMIAAWVGDKDLACEQLAIAIRPPSRLTYGELKLLPFWDPLRGDPRFEQIVASLAPK